MYYRFLFFVLLFFTTCVQAYTYDIYAKTGGSQSCVKNVKDLLNAAYRHYPSIRASERVILGTNAQVEGAKWNYFPTPSVDISQGTSGRKGSTFQLDQPLWTGGKIEALNDLATSRQQEAYSMLDENAYALADKFLNILESFIQAEGEIRGFSEGRKQLESFSSMLNRRVAAGVSSESDRDLLSARIAQIDGDIITAKARYQMAKSQLEILIGKRLQCSIAFKNDNLLKHSMSLHEMQTELLLTHPTLKKHSAQISISKAEKKGADAIIMPNISLRAEHQEGSLYAENITNDTLAYVAVTFSPGAGLSALSDIESAKYKVLQAQDELQTKKAELTSILISDYNNYHSALARTSSVEKTIRSSQKVLDSYTRLFIAGKRQWLDLVNTSREVTQNKLSFATLKAILISSSYRLALQTGRIDFESKGF